MGKDPERKPFLIGLFHGTSKPKNAREFLSTFVDELTSLQLESNMVTKITNVQGQHLYVTLLLEHL